MSKAGLNTFQGSYYKNQLPIMKTGQCCIVNLDDSDSMKGGTHWTALYNMGQKKYYFDSYGFPPPEQIAKKYKNIHWNNAQYQDDSSVACGYYCIYVLIELANGRDFHDILSELDLTNTKKNETTIMNYFIS